jgi:hypothetical protein
MTGEPPNAGNPKKSGTIPLPWAFVPRPFAEAAMQTSELYRQRAAECERMAKKNPSESEQLKKVAQTWLLLAQAAEELSEASKSVAKTLH